MNRAEIVRGIGVVVSVVFLEQKVTSPIRAETNIPVNPIDVIVAREFYSFYGNRPVSFHAQSIVEASSFYGVSQDLLPIISMAESGGGMAGNSWFGLPFFFKTREEEIWYVAKLISGNDPKNPGYKNAQNEIETLQIFNSGHIGGWNDPNYPNKYKTFKSQLTYIREQYSHLPIPKNEEIIKEESA